MNRWALHSRTVSVPRVSQAEGEESCSGEFTSSTGDRKETGKCNKAFCDGKSMSYRICTEVDAFIQILTASKALKNILIHSMNRLSPGTPILSRRQF